MPTLPHRFAHKHPQSCVSPPFTKPNSQSRGAAEAAPKRMDAEEQKRRRDDRKKPKKIQASSDPLCPNASTRCKSQSQAAGDGGTHVPGRGTSGRDTQGAGQDLLGAGSKHYPRQQSPAPAPRADTALWDPGSCVPGSPSSPDPVSQGPHHS